MKVLPAKTKDSETITKIAKEVNEGKWGKGAEIKRRLIQAGYDFSPILKKAKEIRA